MIRSTVPARPRLSKRELIQLSTSPSQLTFATAAHYWRGSAKRKRLDRDLWHLNATKQKQQLRVGIRSGLGKIPAEPLFCDGRSNAAGPCMRSDIHKEALSSLWIQRKPLPFELSRKVSFKVLYKLTSSSRQPNPITLL